LRSLILIEADEVLVEREASLIVQKIAAESDS
jgi:hypothetical protein